MNPPSAERSESIHPEPYARVPDAVRVASPNLHERDSVARQLIESCQSELKVEKDRVRQARLHFEIARLSEVPLGELDVALSHYQQSRALRPRHVPTCSGLRRVRFLRGEWEPGLKVLSDEIELTDKPETRAGLLYEKAVVLEEKVGRHAEARKALKEALDIMPGDRASLRSLLRLARREQDWQAVDKLLEQAAQVSAEDHQLLAARLAEQAHVAEQHRNSAGHAIELYQRSLEADPLSSSATLELERLLGAANRHSDLVNLLKKRVELQTDPRLRASTFVTAGEHVAARLGDPTGAIELFELAHRETPEDLFVLQRLEDLYGRIGDHEGRVSALERQEDQATDPAHQADLRLRIADTYRQRLGKVEEAISWYEKARDVDPAADATVGPLITLYDARQDWDALIRVLLGEEEHCADLHRRAEIHTRVGDIFEHKLRDVDSAIYHFSAALGVQPGYEPAFRALSRLLQSERRFTEVVELHERAVAWARDEDEAVAHLLHIGQVQEDLLREPDRALTAFQRVVERKKSHLMALRAVQRTAERAGQFEQTVVALESEASLLRESSRKVPLLHRAGTIACEQLGDTERGLELYEQVIALNPSYVPALRSVQELHREAGRHRELIKSLELEIGATNEGSAKSPLLLEVGQIYEDHLSDQASALEYYQKAVKQTPDSTVANGHVARMLAALGKHAERAAALEARISDETNPARLAALCMAAGVLYELSLGRPREALNAYERALETGHHHLVARQAQLRMLARLGKHDQYTAAIEDALEQVEADQGDDRSQWTWLYLAAALRLEGAMKAPTKAAEMVDRLLARVPDHIGGLAAQERIFEQDGPVERLRDVLEQQVEALVDPAERVAALRQLARIEQGHLELAEPPDMAKGAAARAIFEQLPEDARSLFELELAAVATKNGQELAQIDRVWIDQAPSQAVRAFHRLRLAEFLEPINAVQALEQHRPALEDNPESIGAARGITRIAEVVDEPELLARAAETEITVVRSPSRSTALSQRAALLLEQAGDHDRAAATLTRALQLNPNDAEAARELQRLLLENGRSEQLIGDLTAAAQQATDQEVAAGHWICVARLLADQRGDLAAAIAALERVEKIHPHHVPTLIELAELCLRDRQWGPASQRLEKALAARPAGAQKRAVHLRLAELYHEHLSRADDAARLLKEALKDDPGDKQALKRLLGIQIERGDLSAAETAEGWVEVAEGVERAEALKILAKVRVKQKRKAEALQAYAQSVEIVGISELGGAAELFKLLHEDPSADFSIYSTALARFAANPHERTERASAYLELGRVLAKRQKQPAEAAEAFRNGLALLPDSLELQGQLAHHLKGMGDFQAALPEYYKLLELGPMSSSSWREIVDVFDQLGKNAESHLALGPLYLLGGGTDLQHSTWNARKPRPAMVSEGAVHSGVINTAVRHSLEDEALQVLSQLSSVLPKVFPTDLEILGVSPKDRVGIRGTHQSRRVLDRVLHAFGVGEIDLYPEAVGATAVQLVYADSLGIVLPTSFAGLTDPEQVFCIARLVANVARDTHVVDALGPAQTEVILAAAANVGGATVEVPGVSSRQLTDVGRRLGKAISWLSRGRYEEASRRYAAQPLVDPGRFTDELTLSALRIALLVADDIAPLRLIERRGSELFGFAEPEIRPILHDLLRYWVSPGAMAVRRELGLA